MVRPLLALALLLPLVMAHPVSTADPPSLTKEAILEDFRQVLDSKVVVSFINFVAANINRCIMYDTQTGNWYSALPFTANIMKKLLSMLGVQESQELKSAVKNIEEGNLTYDKDWEFNCDNFLEVKTLNFGQEGEEETFYKLLTFAHGYFIEDFYLKMYIKEALKQDEFIKELYECHLNRDCFQYLIRMMWTSLSEIHTPKANLTVDLMMQYMKINKQTDDNQILEDNYCQVLSTADRPDELKDTSKRIPVPVFLLNATKDFGGYPDLQPGDSLPPSISFKQIAQSLADNFDLEANRLSGSEKHKERLRTERKSKRQMEKLDKIKRDYLIIYMKSIFDKMDQKKISFLGGSEHGSSHDSHHQTTDVTGMSSLRTTQDPGKQPDDGGSEHGSGHDSHHQAKDVTDKSSLETTQDPGKQPDDGGSEHGSSQGSEDSQDSGQHHTGPQNTAPLAKKDTPWWKKADVILPVGGIVLELGLAALATWYWWPFGNGQNPAFFKEQGNNSKAVTLLTITEASSGWADPLVLCIVAVVVLALIGAGWFIYRMIMKKKPSTKKDNPEEDQTKPETGTTPGITTVGSTLKQSPKSTIKGLSPQPTTSSFTTVSKTKTTKKLARSLIKSPIGSKDAARGSKKNADRSKRSIKP